MMYKFFVAQEEVNFHSLNPLSPTIEFICSSEAFAKLNPRSTVAIFPKAAMGGSGGKTSNADIEKKESKALLDLYNKNDSKLHFWLSIVCIVFLDIGSLLPNFLHHIPFHKKWGMERQGYPRENKLQIGRK
eukprot:m.39457 g.39457  ORF g.39457 m.39457 type:complete len:131 (-) comp6867_c0_seq2:837-1229(-)